jgi:hypothetical protein
MPRRVLVALAGLTFDPSEDGMDRAGFVRTGEALANATITALTSRALLAKRDRHLFRRITGGTPALRAMS